MKILELNDRICSTFDKGTETEVWAGKMRLQRPSCSNLSKGAETETEGGYLNERAALPGYRELAQTESTLVD